MRNRTAMSMVGAIVVAAGSAANASAQTVIYDTLSITNNNLYDRSFGDCIGTGPGSGTISDLQLAEDFNLTGTTHLTRIFADYTSDHGAHPIDAVWVQIFADVGGHPSDDMTADFVASQLDATAIDLGTLNVPAPYNFGVRFSVDLSNAGITLPAGTWWVSVQPVEVETPGWFWILRDFGQVIGFDNHGRNGGTHHTGPYGGHAGVLIDQYNNWARLGDIGFRAGTVPMRIEGDAVCAADFNGDHTLDFFDYLDFVDAFSGNLATADFNHDNIIDFFDYLDFVDAFSGGC